MRDILNIENAPAVLVLTCCAGGISQTMRIAEIGSIIVTLCINAARAASVYQACAYKRIAELKVSRLTELLS